MPSINYVSIFISIFISIFVSIFLLDKLKISLKEMSEGFATELREHARLSKDVNLNRILRVCYVLSVLSLTLLTHKFIHPLTNLIEVVTTVVMASAILPVALLFMSLFFSISFYLMSAIADILLYIFWVPYKLYRDREHPSISQFRMFWFWTMFTALSASLIYQFIHLFWEI